MNPPAYAEVEPLFHRIANTLYVKDGDRLGLAHEDKVAEAAIGFYTGWDAFDSTRFGAEVKSESGARFHLARRYAFNAVRDAIARVIGQRTRPSHAKIYIVNAVSLDTSVAGESFPIEEIIGTDDEAFERYEIQDFASIAFRASEKLDPKYAEVLYRRFALDQTTTEVSKQMGISLGSVHNYQTRALDALRAQLL